MDAQTWALSYLLEANRYPIAQVLPRLCTRKLWGVALTLEFIPIEPSVAMGSDAAESNAAIADVPDQIAATDRAHVAGLVANATARDAVDDLRDAPTTVCDASIRGLLRARELTPPGLARGHEDLDTVTRQGQAAQMLEQAALRG